VSRRDRAIPTGSRKRKTPIDLILQTDSKRKRSTAADQKDDHLRQLLAAVIEQRKDRRRDLSSVKDFFDDPVRFLIQPDVDGGRGTRERRRKQLRARIDVLNALLRLMEGELFLLAHAQGTPGGGRGDSHVRDPAPTSRSSGTS
jgi:hypothetical protein